MSARLDTAVLAARQAGQHQREAFYSRQRVREISPHDIKLQMDVESEDIIRQITHEAFPDYGFLAEESGGSIAADAPTWIVDPLDGTVNYSRQIPQFCTSIALQEDGEFVLGAIYDVMRDELFSAETGEGAFLNSHRLRVSETAEMADAIIVINFAKSTPAILRAMQDINHYAHQVRKIRIMGAAALDLAYVAAGRYDGYQEAGLRTWDVAAGTVIAREAGGRVALQSMGDFIWDVRADNGRLAW